MNTRKTYTVGTAAFLMFLILGTALVGITPIGINEDCKDGIDNFFPPLTGDGNIDADDERCFQYPYADGNGESFTGLEDRYLSKSYVSLFDYHVEYSSDPLDTVCAAISFATYTDSNDLNKANAYINENGPCASGP